MQVRKGLERIGKGVGERRGCTSSYNRKVRRRLVTAKSYLGETGFNRAFLLCHRYNSCKILIPTWLNRRKYIKLAMMRWEIDEESPPPYAWKIPQSC